MALGPWQLVIILIIVLVLFGGRGKISALMGDFGKGLKSFKKGMKDDGAETTDGDKNKKTLKSEQLDAVESVAPESKQEEKAKD
ncbi:MAG: twin-arginine translocase TatA/TatE family subunit [Pseudomonadota bacterium]|nr:twin-arginine translocase TatA/TatE family subunit [Pseudomonadota bacterium]